MAIKSQVTLCALKHKPVQTGGDIAQLVEQWGLTHVSEVRALLSFQATNPFYKYQLAPLHPVCEDKMKHPTRESI